MAAHCLKNKMHVSWPHMLDAWAKHSVNRRVAKGRCLFMVGNSRESSGSGESETGRARVKIPSRTHTHTHTEWLLLSAKSSRYSFEISQTAPPAEAQPVNKSASWGGPPNPSYPCCPHAAPRQDWHHRHLRLGQEWIWLLPPIYLTLDPSHYFLGTAFVSVTVCFSNAVFPCSHLVPAFLSVLLQLAGVSQHSWVQSTSFMLTSFQLYFQPNNLTPYPGLTPPSIAT